jgi:hypothetical protein
VTATQIIKRWLTLWMIDHCLKTKISFRSLKAWITNLNFSNALFVSECLISFTKRELKIRTSERISILLTSKKTFFSSRSAIFCCLDAMNDEDESSMIELRIKLRYAIEAKYFLDCSRSRLIDSVRIIESIAKWSFSNSMNEDIFDDSINEDMLVDDDEFSSLAWSSFW